VEINQKAASIAAYKSIQGGILMLDFTKTKKRFLNVKLVDGTEIMVRMPTKKVFDSLISLQENLNSLELDNTEQIKFVYDLTAEIMSNNLQSKKIDSEYIAEMLDIEDIQIFFLEYVKFVTGQVSDPNSKSPQSQEMRETEGNNDTNVQPSGKD